MNRSLIWVIIKTTARHVAIRQSKNATVVINIRNALRRNTRTCLTV